MYIEIYIKVRIPVPQKSSENCLKKDSEIIKPTEISLPCRHPEFNLSRPYICAAMCKFLPPKGMPKS